jgi:hypothetical protein
MGYTYLLSCVCEMLFECLKWVKATEKTKIGPFLSLRPPPLSYLNKF